MTTRILSQPAADLIRIARQSCCLSVLEALQLEDAALVGFSIGGAISLRYIARHGGRRIGRLALVDAATPVFTRRPDYPYALPVEQVNDLIRQTYRDRPQMLTGLGGMFFNRNIGPDLLDWFHNLGLEASAHATIQGLLSLRDEDSRNDLGQVHVPAGNCGFTSLSIQQQRPRCGD